MPEPADAIAADREARQLQRQAKGYYVERDTIVNAIATEKFGVNVPQHYSYTDDEGTLWAIGLYATLTRVKEERDG